MELCTAPGRDPRGRENGGQGERGRGVAMGLGSPLKSEVGGESEGDGAWGRVRGLTKETEMGQGAGGRGRGSR